MTERARQKARTAESIKRAARRVFGRQGLDATSIRDIVRESGLSRGTFYNHFPSTRAVFEALAGEILETIRLAIREARREASSGRAFLEDAFRAALLAWTADAEALGLLRNSTSQLRELVRALPTMTSIGDELAEDLARATAAGLIPAAPIRLTVVTMLGAALEVSLLLAEDPELDADAAARYLASLYEGGLARIAELEAS